MMAHFPWKRALHSKAVWFSLMVMAAFALTAILGPWLAPQDPYRWGASQADLPPVWVQDGPKTPQADFPLGSDRYGRDILSRLLFGTRTAFFLALMSVPLAGLVGTLVGLTAGYAGGKVDAGLSLLMDMIQSLPGIMFMVMLVLILRSILTPSWFHGLIALVFGFAAVAWVSLARLIRVQVMVLKAQLFVEAAVSVGATPWQIITRHLLPNVSHLIIAWVINNVPAVILIEAVVGYIGIGVTSAETDNAFSVISWGGMFFSGRSALTRSPLMVVIPSVSILLISMSCILLGDFLKGISRPEAQ